MSETKKIVNIKMKESHIREIKIQAATNKRTFQAEHEMILDTYFQSLADRKAFDYDVNSTYPNPTEKTQ